MRAAAAEMRVERGRDVGTARPWIAREQRRRRYQDAGEAIAALAGLLVEERLPQRVQRVVRPEPLDGRDGAAGEACDLPAAGIRRLAVDQYHAGAALLGAAAEPAAAQAELVAQ